MSNTQLDLFCARANPVERVAPGDESRPAILWSIVDDDCLVAALPHAGMSDSLALAAEAGRRGLGAAVPALESLCRRFTGFGVDRIVPEQAAALDALVMIGGSGAAQAVTRLIVKTVVQGPCLQRAVTAAARLGAKLPAGAALDLLRHGDPQIRADACRCVRPWPETAPLLVDLLDDLHPQVRMAAACALGRIGRNEVRSLLAGYLLDEPSAELIDAITAVADEDCVILLGRIARALPDLSAAALDALDAIDHPRADKIATAIREIRPT